MISFNKQQVNQRIDSAVAVEQDLPYPAPSPVTKTVLPLPPKSVTSNNAVPLPVAIVTNPAFENFITVNDTYDKVKKAALSADICNCTFCLRKLIQTTGYRRMGSKLPDLNLVNDDIVEFKESLKKYESEFPLIDAKGDDETETKYEARLIDFKKELKAYINSASDKEKAKTKVGAIVKGLEDFPFNFGKVRVDGVPEDKTRYNEIIQRLMNSKRGRRHTESWPTRLYNVNRGETVGGEPNKKFICISYTWPDISKVRNGWWVRDITDDHKWEVKSISREGLALIIDAMDIVLEGKDGNNVFVDEKGVKGDRMIWSDSLCVDQLDKHDLQVETARSGHYYASCEFCLVALWNRIDPNAVKSQVTNFLRWCGRAWTAQEALLPKRLYLLALMMKEGSLKPAVFDIDSDEIEVFTDWLGGSVAVAEALLRTRKLRATFKNATIGLSDALAITLNREATFGADKIYAAATMARIGGRIGNREEEASEALDWVYRQLLPSDRVKLALVSCRPNPNLEGGCWLPSTGHVFEGYSIEVKDTKAVISKYLRGENMELFTQQCCDIVILPDRPWTKPHENLQDREPSPVYAQSTVIADKTDSFYWAQAIVNPGFTNRKSIKILASNGIYQGRYRFVAVGELLKPSELQLYKLKRDLSVAIGKDNVKRLEDQIQALNSELETEAKKQELNKLDEDYIKKIEEHIQDKERGVLGILLANLGEKKNLEGKFKQLWSKVGLAVVPQNNLKNCGPHHEVMCLG
ncbi:hypothetical protein HDU99_000927 [Rhizoclosmatium hyalinum]|nr:hypothetical protein HDU99_000927 [Rhizoclosmatium hyalinum]